MEILSIVKSNSDFLYLCFLVFHLYLATVIHGVYSRFTCSGKDKHSDC